MIVTITMNPAVDKFAKIGQIAPDQKLRCQEPRLDPGGGGINVSRTISRLGGESLAVFPAGGPTGEMLKSMLEAEGVSTRTIEIEELTRINLFVLEEVTGQLYRFNFPGAAVQENEWKQCNAVLSAIEPVPDLLLGSGSLPPGMPADYYARLPRLASEMSCRFILDTSQEPLRLAVDAGLYMIKPNVRELNQLAGKELAHEQEQIRFSQDLIDKGCVETVVLSLGAGGALLITADEHEHVRTPTVPIESRTGAGDSMVGAMAWRIAQRDDLQNAVRYGVAAGAAAVMTEGTELCRRSDVEKLYRRMAES